MRGLFVGGPWDGQFHEVFTVAPVVIVPVVKPQSASVEDFNLINLDHVWNGRPPPPTDRHEYRLDGMHRDRDGAEFALYKHIGGGA